MKDKIISLCIPITLALMILGLSIWNLITPDKLFSEYENRVLSKRPQFSFQAFFQGSFTDDYENYLTDQFVFRNEWISMKTRTDVLLGKKDINGVYLAKDRTFIEMHLQEDFDQGLIAKRMELLKKLKEEYPKLQVMLIPTGDNILSDRLPDYAEYYDQSQLLWQVEQAIGDESVINSFEVLTAHKSEYIYYGTDHHWTTEGAYYGYEAWCNKMNMTPVSDNCRVVANDFYGTLHSKTNLPVASDFIMAYIPEKEVEVYYDFSDKKVDSLYVESYLDTKNKYGYFLDDNHPFLEIDVKNSGQEIEERTLFVLKDSYANCFLPFLTNHYDKIYVMDLRHYHGKLFSIMENYGQKDDMVVLVLYNVVHFLQEFQYY